MTSADISGRSVSSVRSFITDEAVQKSATNLVPTGTVLLVTRTGVGKVAIADTPVCFSQDITALIPNPRALDPTYLAHFLETQQTYFERIARGATIKGITRDVVARLQIPLPPLAEQRRIAEILDLGYAISTKRLAALEMLPTMSRSVFLEIFERPEADWPMRTIAEIADSSPGAIRTGPFGSQLLHGEFVSEGVAVLGIDNAVSNEFQWAKLRYITRAKYQSLRRYTVKPGDVLITIMGTCGRCAIVPNVMPLAINTKHLCCITLDRRLARPEYLHAYFLLHPIAQRYLSRSEKGAIMSGLNMAIIKAMPIPLPPLALQDYFAKLVDQWSVVRGRLRASLVQLDSLSGSLQNRAFRGDL